MTLSLRPDDDLLLHIEQPTKRHRNRSGLKSASTSLTPGQSSEASTSQGSDTDNHPYKRTSGLKAMDRVVDDVDWIDPSAQESRLHLSAHRKAISMTSNRYGSNMLDTERTFGDQPV